MAYMERLGLIIVKRLSFPGNIMEVDGTTGLVFGKWFSCWGQAIHVTIIIPGSVSQFHGFDF